MPYGRQLIVQEIERVADALSGLGVDDGLPVALRKGATALSAGRLLMIDDVPQPYVCRTCGHLALGTATEKCPTCGYGELGEETAMWLLAESDKSQR